MSRLPGGPRTPERRGHMWRFHERLQPPADQFILTPKTWVVIMGMSARDREQTLYMRCWTKQEDGSWWTEI